LQREKRKALAILLLVITTFPLTAVDVENSPGWLILEKGKQLFDAGEYGDAMFYFRKAHQSLGASPEVEYWIGRVFEAEGEYTLAAQQYETAVEKRRLLLVPGEELAIRHRLAEVYATERDFKAYADELEAIIGYDTSKRIGARAIVFEPRTIADVLADRGYNKLLELYRIEDYGALGTYYDLGIYEYRSGLFEAAVEHLAYSFTITYTTVIKHLIFLDPEFRFVSLTELLREAMRIEKVADYIYRADAFGQMYALGTALYETGELLKREIARDLWRTVIDYDEQGWWREKAARQLQSPFSDDFMLIFPE